MLGEYLPPRLGSPQEGLPLLQELSLQVRAPTHIRRRVGVVRVRMYTHIYALHIDFQHLHKHNTQQFDPAAGAGPCFTQTNPVCSRPGYASATAALFRGLLRLDGLPIGG